jgi:hypothetical protein
MARNRVAAALVCAALICAPPAAAEPVQEAQCSDPTYAKLHPSICTDSGAPFLLGGGQYSGSGGGSGLLGGLGGIVHTVTGGLL